MEEDIISPETGEGGREGKTAKIGPYQSSADEKMGRGRKKLRKQ